MPYSLDSFAESITEFDKFKVIEKMHFRKVVKILKVQDYNYNYFAVKIINKKASSKLLLRFQREIVILKSLHNISRIPNLHALGKINGDPYYVMDYVEGISLKKYLQMKKKIPEKEALEIIKYIAQIVNQIHQKHIFHRDVSPNNIIICNNTVYIIDFGLSFMQDNLNISQFGECLGTLNYMAPEQANGELRKIGAWSDIFSIGSLLYFMLTGVPPFCGNSKFESLGNLAKNNLRSIDEYDLNISDTTKFIITKSLCPDIERRYQKVDDLMVDVLGALNLVSISNDKGNYFEQDYFEENNLTKNKSFSMNLNSSAKKTQTKKRAKINTRKKELRVKKNLQKNLKITHLALSCFIGLLLAAFILMPLLWYKQRKNQILKRDFAEKKKKELFLKKMHIQEDKKRIIANINKNDVDESAYNNNESKKYEWVTPVLFSAKFRGKFQKKGNTLIATVDKPFGLIVISDFPKWENYEFKANIFVEEGVVGIFVRNFDPITQFPHFLGQMGVRNYKNRWFSVTAKVFDTKVTVSVDGINRQLVKHHVSNVNPGIVGFGLNVAQQGVPAFIRIKNIKIRQLSRE